MSTRLEELQFLLPQQVQSIAQRFGTPVYVYSEQVLRDTARAIAAFPSAFGHTARYAMKAATNRAILNIFHQEGLHIDASSGYEVTRALKAGIPPQHILLTAQEFPHNIEELIPKGVLFNATSLSQLERFGLLFPNQRLGLRFNPGWGAGGTSHTNVGGPTASFGIWHDYIEKAVELTERFELYIERIHTHLGSGTDPKLWQKVAEASIDLLDYFPHAQVLNIGGGLKVGRMRDDSSADLKEVGGVIRRVFEAFAERSGRRIRLEIEPGTFLVATAGCIIARVEDVVDTGSEGYLFYKLDTGMSEIIRPAMYGAQHPLVVVEQEQPSSEGEQAEAIVVGHCCESGDILTPLPGEPNALGLRSLARAQAGDLMVIEGAGAYCSSMASKNYSSFPEAAEVLVRSDGEPVLIRVRQTVEQIVQNEVELLESDPNETEES